MCNDIMWINLRQLRSMNIQHKPNAKEKKACGSLPLNCFGTEASN